METKNCKWCGKLFEKKRPKSFCSRSCAGKGIPAEKRKFGGRSSIPESEINMHKYWSGKKFSTIHRKNISASLSGLNNRKWKGDGVAYRTIHNWVQRRLGTPDTCEHCGSSGLKGRQIHWANKSRSYKRDLQDWIRLCRHCHKKYDSIKL